MNAKRKWADPIAACRIALQRGNLTQDKTHWIFARRRFHPATVAKLIEIGEAVRDGDVVRAT